MAAQITNPHTLDPQETIFYMDLRHYEWDRNDGWTKIEQAYPYHISFDAPAHLALRNQLGRLQTQMKTDVPSVHIDWFIATASTPPLYHELLSLPLTVGELESRLEVDIARNLRDATGIAVWRAGFNNSGVSNHNRVVERHTSQHGAYWKSYDFAGSAGTQNIFTHPLNFTHDGGEVIFNLPNGLQGYYLVDGNGLRLNEAPISIVSNPAASDPTVRNGISCIGCHTVGMKTFEDEVRSAIEGNPNPPYNKAHALRLYVEKSVMDALVAEDMEKYRVALEATGGTFSGVEPVSRSHEAFHAPIDVAYAAAVVGLRTDTFLEKVRENTGLQSAGLLALESENGSVKRDAWTSSFRDIISALDSPDRVGQPPVITQPDVLPGGQVHFPDANLRAVLEEVLATKTIRTSTMANLTTLKVDSRGISDLRGLEFATNLEQLVISENPVSDLSPIASCVNLVYLRAWGVGVQDISPLAGLTKLERIEFKSGLRDISPLAGLTKLKKVQFYGGNISDISALASSTGLKHIEIRHNAVRDLSPLENLNDLEIISMGSNEVVDISPIGNLTKMAHVNFNSNRIRNVSPLRELTNLTELRLATNEISDLTPLAELIHLRELHVSNNRISDVSPLTGLINLRELHLGDNKISNISPLAELTNLKSLDVAKNQIADFSPLYGLFGKTAIIGTDNPGYPTGGPKIEGPWLWLHIPNRTIDSDFGIDYLSEVSGDTVTEIGIATLGATAGNSVGDEVWTSHKLPTTGQDNIKDMLGRTPIHGAIYGNVSLYSPVEQSTTIHIRAYQRVKVWGNGTLIYQRDSLLRGEGNYTEFCPVTLREGRNVLLIVTDLHRNEPSYAFFGFESDTEYTVINPSINYTFSKTPITLGGTFMLNIRAEGVFDMAGWQFDLAFDPAVLEAKGVNEGDFLKSDGGATFFQSGSIDNAAGKITGLIAGRISEGGASGSGSLLQVEFTAKSEGETKLALEDFEFGSITGENIPAGPLEIRITVEERLLTGDVNRDGRVSILDLILVAQQLGKRVAADSPADVNGDGIVNIFDLTLVAQGIVGAAAPAVATNRVDAATIEAWIALARLEDDSSIAFQQGVANLEALLTTMIPKQTALLPNYPNPFNPEPGYRTS